MASSQVQTPRSSFTLHDPHPDSSAVVSSVPSIFDREPVYDEEDSTPVYIDAGSSNLPPKPTGNSGRAPLDEEISWDGPDDPANPKNWTDRRKWMITLTCILMTVNVTFASSAPTSATVAILEAFNVSEEVSYLITTTFLLGYVFGPFFWGPGSELVGRRPIFVFAMSAYTILILGQGLAQNIETLLITRFLAGFFAVAPLVNSGGVIADIWDAETRGTASSMFSAIMGPIVAGFIVESSLGWRWVFWVMMIFAGTCTLVTIFTLPETYSPVLLVNKLKAKRKADPACTQHLFAAHERQDWSLKGILNRTLFRPFRMLAGEPILVLVTLYLSLVYGVVYCLFEAFPIIFIEKRGFTITQNGLIFIGIGIGTTLGAVLNVYHSRHYPELIKTWRGYPPPEERLFSAMVGGCAFAVGIFWLGWSGHYPSVPWYVPALSTVVVGVSISSIFISFLSYLVDTYVMYSASAFAANTFCRSLVAAAFPLFTVQMFTKLGVNWAATLLGGVGLLLAPSSFLFYKYGARIRANSKFAPCTDLKIAKIIADEKALAEGEKPTV
ncbi:major facilitator superfamily domain-containing protein [Mycena galopus ATCC 62051]|nr:major facilitator superfamily domain-containing protein [Mycena galopus ATCC 62051]